MTTVVIVPRWGDDSEEERMVRPLVDFLCTHDDVDLVALEGAGGAGPRGSAALVEISRRSEAGAARAIARRAIAVAAVAAGRPREWLPEPARTALIGHVETCWDRAIAHVATRSPSTVVVCGGGSGSALRVFHALGGDVCRVVLPLTPHHRPSLGADDVSVCRDADVRLAVDRAERTWLEAVTGAEWTAVGTVVEHPPTDHADLPRLLTQCDYVAVVDRMSPGSGWSDATDGIDGDRVPSRTAGWLAAAIGSQVVALELGDLVQWSHGNPVRTPVTERQRWAVLLGARAVVAADPGSVLGWGVLAALSCGRPVVTLSDSAGASYIVESGGGLVASDLVEVIEGVRGLLEDPARAEELGRVGASWATVQAGSAQLFAERLVAAGLSKER